MYMYICNVENLGVEVGRAGVPGPTALRRTNRGAPEQGSTRRTKSMLT